MNKNFLKLSFGTFLAAATITAQAKATEAQLSTLISRPPQFVMIGFDGGLDPAQWQATRDLAKELNSKNKAVHFTYFISGAYLLRDANRTIYQPPKRKEGYSAIGFGGNSTQVADRMKQINSAFSEGHEIANRGNGHLNGKLEQWTEADWNQELRQFNDLLFGVYFNNNITPDRQFAQGFAFKEKDIIGFRAPQLGTNDALFPALKNQRIKYDTSTVSSDTQWPSMDKYGIWRISIPMLELGDTGKRITGLDYNFYYTQSGAKADLNNKEKYKSEMLHSYRKYFAKNYYSGRAPIKIGHHFENFNGGAYWEALKEFASDVCGKPEVQCVTYKEYVEWLESLSPEILTAYKEGRFERMTSDTTQP